MIERITVEPWRFRMRGYAVGSIVVLSGLVFGLAGAAPAAALDAQAGGQPLRHRSTVTYSIPGDMVFPEGVAYDRRTGYFYVSGALDGTIYRGHVARPALEVFLPHEPTGRTDANGLKIDERGRLYVAGGGSGQIFVYDTGTRTLIRRFTTGAGGFINDLTFDRSGDAYFTDSIQPTLWRVRADEVRPTGTPGQAEAFLDFTGTVVVYQQEGGFNLNGIVASGDGRALYTVQYNTGKLFLVTLGNRTVAEVRVTGADLLSGDGMLRLGNLLLFVLPDRGVLATVRLDRTGLAAGGVNEYADRTFRFPTTAAFARDRVLVVNSQFDQIGGTPEPFTVSGVPLHDVLTHTQD